MHDLQLVNIDTPPDVPVAAPPCPREREFSEPTCTAGRDREILDAQPPFAQASPWTVRTAVRLASLPASHVLIPFSVDAQRGRGQKEARDV